ncbi:hypothetical protein V4C53_35525 [Paraburkholderia azotifigens]|uniref:hypothetical protein n=1 Tax=Paraburkholderia azotifigens TaxID=2057004 RepID=UPI0031737AE1
MKTLFAWIGALAVVLTFAGILGIADVRLCVGAVGTCNGPAHTANTRDKAAARSGS